MFSRAIHRLYVFKGGSNHVIAAAGLLLACLSSVHAADEKAATAAQQGATLYARVGDREITLDQYNQSYYQTVRKRYYHSKPPEAELAAVREEIGEDLIMRELLLMEAGRLGLEPDGSGIQAQLAKYDERYADSPRWKEQRGTMLGALKPKLEQDDLLKQIESRVRNIAPPSDQQLKTFYEQSPEKFTEPMQMKLSLILLVVDPSSPTEVWQAAMDEGGKLVEQLRGGADFGELARTYSGDVSAEKGGDMGYVHREMLSSTVEQAIDKLQQGQISDPIRTLQGVAILRLDDRKPARLREFAEVRERARELWLRDRSDAAWAEFKQKLRQKTPVTIFVDVTDTGGDV